MFARRDRRELGLLGLLVLAWGLLVAPLVHALTHPDSHDHSHRPGKQPSQPNQQHGAGSLEHLLAIATQAPGLPDLQQGPPARGLIEASSPASPIVESWNQVEESQGP